MRISWLSVAVGCLLSVHVAVAQEYESAISPLQAVTVEPILAEPTPVPETQSAAELLPGPAPLAPSTLAPQPQTISIPSAGSPEMLLYMQQRKDHLDPELAIRQRAATYAEQRQQRIAARAWYGLSAARPIASPTPHMAGYSPSWQTNLLRPAPAPTIVVEPAQSSSRYSSTGE